MIKIKINLNFQGLHDDVEKFESRSVRVGPLSNSAYARKPELRKRGADKPPTKSLKEARGRVALRVRGQNKKLKMKRLAEILDQKYGVFTYADLKFADRDLKQIIELLADTFGSPVATHQQRRIENACIALVRNPIMNKQFGMNSPRWAKTKGFDWTMVSTGSFLQSIEARMNV